MINSIQYDPYAIIDDKKTLLRYFLEILKNSLENLEDIFLYYYIIIMSLPSSGLESHKKCEKVKFQLIFQ